MKQFYTCLFQFLLCCLALNTTIASPESCEGIDESCELRKPQLLDGVVVGCLSLEQGPRTIYDDDTWKFVQDVYDELFYSQTKDNHEYGYIDSFEYYILNEEEEGPNEDMEDTDTPFTSIIVPHEIRYLPNGGGRGVFITEDLKESDVVFTPDAYGVFRTESSWKKFISIIASENVELACDALQWSYVQALEDGYGVCMDLSVASYLNHGGTENANLLVINEIHTAKRDISAGEELLDDYLKYHEFGKLPWYEDMVLKAWDDECNIFQCQTDGDSLDEQQWSYRVTRKK